MDRLHVGRKVVVSVILSGFVFVRVQFDRSESAINKRGFTFIELLVLIAIIGILAANGISIFLQALNTI